MLETARTAGLKWNRQNMCVKVIWLTVVGDIISTAGVKSDSKEVQTDEMISGHLEGVAGEIGGIYIECTQAKAALPRKILGKKMKVTGKEE